MCMNIGACAGNLWLIIFIQQLLTDISNDWPGEAKLLGTRMMTPDTPSPLLHPADCLWKKQGKAILKCMALKRDQYNMFTYHRSGRLG